MVRNREEEMGRRKRGRRRKAGYNKQQKQELLASYLLLYEL
jgi:hypothetical protein